jgi:hypothetical protein
MLSIQVQKVRTLLVGSKIRKRSKDKLEHPEPEARGRSDQVSEKYISASLFKEVVIPSINKTFQNEETMRLTLVGVIEKSLDVFPAADVEPVVRCRDCVAYAGKERKGGGIMMICRINKHEASPEHFCSQGRNRAHMERSGSGETY